MDNSKNFSIKEKLNSLCWLQYICSKIDQIHILRGELPNEVKEIEEILVKLNQDLIANEERINGINEYIIEHQEKIKQAKALIVRYEKQSDNVKNNREFEAINKEIETQQRDIKIFEKYVRDANEDLKDTIHTLENIKKNIAVKEITLKSKKENLNVILKQTDKDEKEWQDQLTEAQKKIDSNLYDTFNRIRKNFKNGLAVVKIERQSCAGCFNMVPPQRHSEIRIHKKIIHCENCGRILIDDDVYDETIKNNTSKA